MPRIIVDPSELPKFIRLGNTSNLHMQPFERTFWTYVNRRGPVLRDGTRCWDWTRPYGSIRPTFCQLYVYRIAWLLTRGPIPVGLEVCHHCDRGVCVNPEHLFLGTHAENMADMARKGRSQKGKPGKRGAENPAAILTAEDVIEIRRQLAMGTRRRAIAEMFGVKRCTIMDINSRRSWAHL